MSRQLLLLTVALAASGGGCTTCHYAGYRDAYQNGADCDLTQCQRDKVYAVLVGGADPYGTCDLANLRDQLCRAGFPKVYYGQPYHAWCMKAEMRCVHVNEPNARFLVVGYDLGGPVAVRLAATAAEEGLPVAGVVLLDPVKEQELSFAAGRPNVPEERKYPTFVLESPGWTAGSERPPSERVVIADATHSTLPGHCQTFATVHARMADEARRMPLAIEGYVPGMSVDPDPTPRPMTLPQPRGVDEWSFLRPRNSALGLAPLPAPVGKAAPTPPQFFNGTVQAGFQTSFTK